MAENAISGLKTLKPWQKYAIIGGGGAVVVFVWYRHKQSAAAAASSTASGTGTDPVTGLPYAEDNQVDPVTGITYLQEAQEYGSVAAAESAVSSGATAGYGGGYSYGNLYGNSAGISDIPYSDFSGVETGSNYTSNAEWAQAATAGLIDLGYTSTDIAAALGNYLAGLALTSGQQQIVYAAIAEYGEPPAPVPAITSTNTNTGTSTTGNTTPTTYTVVQGDTLSGIAKKLGVNVGALYQLNAGVIGPNPDVLNAGEVLQIPPAGATGTLPSAPSSTPTTTVPNCVGLWAEDAQPACTAAGLKSTLSGPSFKTGTSAVRVITSQSPPPGAKVAKGTNCTLNYRIQQ